MKKVIKFVLIWAFLLITWIGFDMSVTKLEQTDAYFFFSIFIPCGISAIITNLKKGNKKENSFKISKKKIDPLEEQYLRVSQELNIRSSSRSFNNKIEIIRVQKFVGAGVKHKVYLDGQYMGKVKNGKRMVIGTFPGVHTIIVQGIFNQKASIDFEIFEDQYVTHIFDEFNVWGSKINLTIMACTKSGEVFTKYDLEKRKNALSLDKKKYWIKGDIDLLKTDLVEIGHVEVCCEKCARYRDRIFSLTGKDKRFPKIPEDFDSSCCKISLWPFVWGVSEPSFQCNDPITYSNRPFVDERTEEEKERYENWKRKSKIDQNSHSAYQQISTPVRVKDRDPLEIIRIMERRFEEQYQFAYKHLFNLHDCQKMFEQTVKEFDSIELPLMAQIRFEQLCAEYKEKFNIINPLVVVDAMDGHAFEEWCAELLRKNGFVNVEVTAGSGDQGVDVIAVKDGVRYAIQCKCYSSDLSNKPVQEVHTGKSIYKCQVGVVMTNRHFTPGAKEAADATGVLLWDRDKLEELISNEKAGE